MAENTLEKIIEKKINKINNLKKNITIDSLKKKITENNSFIDFKEKIEKNIKSNKISIIAEIKKASPSAGVIIKDYDPLKIAEIYKSNKATCLSVLTEEDFFFGNLMHISKIKQKINLPILCKDFFIDSVQFPIPEIQDDPFFGPSEIYHNVVEATLRLTTKTEGNSKGILDIAYQGCWEGGVCYPLLKTSLTLSGL